MKQQTFIDTSITDDITTRLLNGSVLSTVLERVLQGRQQNSETGLYFDYVDVVN